MYSLVASSIQTNRLKTHFRSQTLNPTIALHLHFTNKMHPSKILNLTIFYTLYMIFLIDANEYVTHYS